MHRTIIRAWIVALFLVSATASASADRQAFLGFGPGLEVLSNTGSGTGFYIQGFGGYNFTSMVGMGLHAGYSNVGGVGVSTADFGTFGQLLDPTSGLYGRFYLDGLYGSVSGGGLQHGINGNQLGFAPGVGLGMQIPTAGYFHMAPQLDYRVAFMQSAVNIIDMSFNLMWDF